MDNLVRLTIHQDPDPGRSKTSQICTLPISLNGLPKNCSVVKTWHDVLCEAEYGDECTCFESKSLGKEDLNVLLENADEEKQMCELFSVQSTWAIANLLHSIEDQVTFSKLLDVLNETRK